jgi:hypothetical protein
MALYRKGEMNLDQLSDSYPSMIARNPPRRRPIDIFSMR